MPAVRSRYPRPRESLQRSLQSQTTVSVAACRHRSSRPGCAGSSSPTRSTGWGPGSAWWRCRSPSSTIRTARSRSPRCCSPWQALPAFLVPAVVARVEASARRRELSALYFFEAIVTAALAVLLWHFWLPAVLLLAALDGTAALAASALLRAEVARAAREQVEAAAGRRRSAPGREPRGRDAQEAERKANAALNVAFSATFVAGPVLGGVGRRRRRRTRRAVHRRRLVSDLRRAAARPAPPRRGGRGDSVRARLRAAWRHINEAPSLRGLLLAEAVALIFVESAGPIEVDLREGNPARRRSWLRPAR